MPILVGDVKLVASQVMDDVAEGGGAPTSTVIVDGASNSLFNDISEMDRAGGRVNLRKVFASVQTDTTDTYLGGNVIVAEAPSDAASLAPSSSSTSAIVTRAPSATNSLTVAPPIPLAPPVTSATFPSSCPMSVSSRAPAWRAAYAGRYASE